MAQIKLAYIGGGSTRAPGTMSSLIQQGENFSGSEIVLVDLDEAHLNTVRRVAEKLIAERHLNLSVSTSTDRRSALQDCDAVLTSFRPGGFEMRHLDERIPLTHGVIGQETQGPGGFFMALRSIHAMKSIVRDMEELCPRAILFNYTNPVNIVSQAIVDHTSVHIISLCEGPIIFPQMVARAAGLDSSRVDALMVGLNHACWSIRQEYNGCDMLPLVREAYEKTRNDRSTTPHRRRLLELTSAMDSLPADYFQYYYFKEELLAELHAKPTTRAEDILKRVPQYWSHYDNVASMDGFSLDPAQSRGGINELELAIDVMDAVFNDRNEIWPVNVRNAGSLPDLPDHMIVEVPGLVNRNGAAPQQCGYLPEGGKGLVKMLGEYQLLAARAGWEGTRRDAVRALASNPLVLSLRTAAVLFDEMSAAQRDYLPDRLFR